MASFRINIENVPVYKVRIFNIKHLDSKTCRNPYVSGTDRPSLFISAKHVVSGNEFEKMVSRLPLGIKVTTSNERNSEISQYTIETLIFDKYCLLMHFTKTKNSPCGFDDCTRRVNSIGYVTTVPTAKNV